jgi:hypothetical protein
MAFLDLTGELVESAFEFCGRTFAAKSVAAGGLAGGLRPSSASWVL